MQKGLWATLRGRGDQRSSHGSGPYPSLATAFNVNVRNAAGGRGRTFGWEMVSSKKEKYQSSTGTVEAKGVPWCGVRGTCCTQSSALLLFFPLELEVTAGPWGLRLGLSLSPRGVASCLCPVAATCWNAAPYGRAVVPVPLALEAVGAQCRSLCAPKLIAGSAAHCR